MSKLTLQQQNNLLSLRRVVKRLYGAPNTLTHTNIYEPLTGTMVDLVRNKTTKGYSKWRIKGTGAKSELRNIAFGDPTSIIYAED